MRAKALVLPWTRVDVGTAHSEETTLAFRLSLQPHGL